MLRRLAQEGGSWEVPPQLPAEPEGAQGLQASFERTDAIYVFLGSHAARTVSAMHAAPTDPVLPLPRLPPLHASASVPSMPFTRQAG